MRQRVDQQKIELFLQQLGRHFTKPGRVYLVGGNKPIQGKIPQRLITNLLINVIRGRIRQVSKKRAEFLSCR